MKKLGLMSLVLAPLAVAACAAQLVAQPAQTPKSDILIAGSPRPVIVASGAPSGETIVKDAYVKAYQHAASAEPGETVSLEVEYGLADPSWSFDKLTVEVDEAEKLIHVKPTMSKRAPRPGGGMAVPAVIVDRKATAQFVIHTPGRYRLVSPRYLSGEVTSEIMIGEEAAAPVMSLRIHGGRCPDGACDRTIQIMSDGTYTDTTEASEQGNGQVPKSLIETLVQALEKADYEALKATPFTGTCPTAFDGSETVYTFHTAEGSEELATCKFVLDPADPLIAAADAIRAHVDGLGK